MSTKSELLAVAKTLEIAGRHEMTKEQLETAIANAQPVQVVEEAPVVDETTLITENTDTKAKVKEVVRRYPSLRERDQNGRVVRAGRNLSGNQPFKRKYYYLSAVAADQSTWTVDYATAFNAAPKQVRDILTFMAREGITEFSKAKTGPTIGDLAKASGILVSKINSDALFAYYRRAMEVLGLIHAGTFSDEEVEDGALEGEDAEDQVEETEDGDEGEE